MSGTGMDLNRRVDASQYGADDMPLYPARVLLRHVLVKGVQAGSLAGLVIAPLWAFSRSKPLVAVAPRVLAVTTVGAAAVSMGMLLMKEYQGALTPEGVDDRAYRLSKNVGQVTIDQYSGIGAVVGAAYNSIFGRTALRSVALGGIMGVAAGAAYYGFERYMKEGSAAFTASKPAPM